MTLALGMPSRVLPADESGNSLVGQTEALDSARNIVYNANPDQSVQIFGVEDLVVVVTPDAVMVCPKERAQEESG